MAAYISCGYLTAVFLIVLMFFSQTPVRLISHTCLEAPHPIKIVQIMGTRAELKPVMHYKQNSTLNIIQMENQYILFWLRIIPALQAHLC